MKDTLFSLLSILIMIFSYKEAVQIIPFTVEGTVAVQDEGTPVPRAHVFVINGEEEIFTDDKGKFRFTTWQNLPVQVTISHTDYEEQKVTIRSAARKAQVLLKKRSS
jgi:hypothetical protein